MGSNSGSIAYLRPWIPKVLLQIVKLVAHHLQNRTEVDDTYAVDHLHHSTFLPCTSRNLASIIYVRVVPQTPPFSAHQVSIDRILQYITNSPQVPFIVLAFQPSNPPASRCRLPERPELDLQISGTEVNTHHTT